MKSGFFNAPKAVAASQIEIDIPAIIHMIWFGSMLSDKYQSNVIAAKKYNPDYITILYSDSASMHAADFQLLSAFCETQKVILVDFNTLKNEEFKNLAHVRFELSNKKWARASDIARATILHMQGGIYLDTDLTPKRGFGKLASRTGTLQYVVYQDGNLFINIYFMAAAPQHPAYKAIMTHLDNIYQIALRHEDHLLWMNSLDKTLCILVTGHLSGGAFKAVLEELFPKAWLAKCHIELDRYIDIHCDHSWITNGDNDKIAATSFYKYINDFFAYRNSDKYRDITKIAKQEVKQMLSPANHSKAQPRKQMHTQLL